MHLYHDEDIVSSESKTTAPFVTGPAMWQEPVNRWRQQAAAVSTALEVLTNMLSSGESDG